MAGMLKTIALALLAVAPSLAAAPAAAEPAGALAACANPALPHDILAGAFAGAAAPLPTIRVGGAAVPLVLAVASDQHARELGLMCVTRLRPHAGMIFVFSEASIQEFWMKNTLVPLDMVWVDAGGTVTTVAGNVPASTRSTPDDVVARRRGQGLFVIELAAGEAAADGIAAGTKLLLPSTLRSAD
jgi:uncharacterized membrane protein (UPF0127 family)